MATREQKTATDLEAQAIALAEQLGRIAGTIEGTAESWLQRQKLADQLTRVRDSATQMLESLADGAERGRNAATAVVRRVRLQPDRGPAQTKPAPRMAQPDPARAPGKKRRKPGPTLKGVKKSDEKIPKLRTAAAARQRRKSYA